MSHGIRAQVLHRGHALLWGGAVVGFLAATRMRVASSSWSLACTAGAAAMFVLGLREFARHPGGAADRAAVKAAARAIDAAVPEAVRPAALPEVPRFPWQTWMLGPLSYSVAILACLRWPVLTEFPDGLNLGCLLFLFQSIALWQSSSILLLRRGNLVSPASWLLAAHWCGLLLTFVMPQAIGRMAATRWFALSGLVLCLAAATGMPLVAIAGMWRDRCRPSSPTRPQAP